MVAMVEAIMFAFPQQPEIYPVELNLKGTVVKPGDKIRGLFGPMTSSMMWNFHPIAPWHLVYEGIYEDLWNTLICCSNPKNEPWQEDCDGNKFFCYWGWIHLESNDEFFTLLRSGGNGRVVQYDFVYLNDDMPPLECLEDKYYWKKKAGRKLDRRNICNLKKRPAKGEPFNAEGE